MKISSALAITLAPAVALAHPGHGTTEPQSWAHYLTEPVHIAGVAAIAAIAILLERARSRRRADS